MLTVKHPFFNPKGDGADTTVVRPSDWNASHALTGQVAFSELGGNIAVGQMASGSGASLSTFWRGDGTWATPAGGGGTPGGASTNVQFNSASAFGGDSGFTYAGSGKATLALGTVTANAKALNITGTWNNSGVMFDAPLFMNIIDTASAASSKYLEIQRGGVTEILFDRGDGGYFGPGVYVYNAGSGIKSGIWTSRNQGAGLFMSGNVGSQAQAVIHTLSGIPQFDLSGGAALGWQPVGPPAQVIQFDTALWRDGSAGIIAQRNSTNAQSFRVYNTYTDASNYERGVFGWATTANTLTIGIQAAGTGSTSRGIQFVQGGSIVGDIGVTISGVWTLSGVQINTSGFTVTSNNNVSYAANTIQAWNGDVGLARSAAGVLQVTNGWTLTDGILKCASITLGADPTIPLGAATKQYVDAHAGGGTPGGASTNVQFNSSSAFGGDSGFTYAGSGKATLALGTITANAKALNITGTWNNAAVTFDAPLFMNITNTASNAASMLMDLQVGGSSVLSVSALRQPGNNTGVLVFGAPVAGQNLITAVGPSGYLSIIGMGNNSTGNTAPYGLFISATANLSRVGFGTDFDGANCSVLYLEHASGLGKGAGMIGWGANAVGGTAPDLYFGRDAANISAQRNSTTAQSFRVYNTFTDASNYERGVFDWTTTPNTLTIGMQNAGTGAARDLTVRSKGNINLQIDAASAALSFISYAGNIITQWYQANLIFSSNLPVGWSNSTNIAGVADVNLSRAAASVLQIGDNTSSGINAKGWIQWAGLTRVTADFTVTSSVALTNITGLSVNVQAGRTYQFMTELYVTDAAAGGVQAAIAGTATATAIQYTGYTIADNAIKGKASATALGVAVGSTTTTETAGIVVRITGIITVNVAGTLTVQMAQNTSNATATTAKRGSWFIVNDMP